MDLSNGTFSDLSNLELKITSLGSKNQKIQDYYHARSRNEPLPKFDSLIYTSPRTIVDCSGILDFRLNPERQTVTAGYIINCLPQMDLTNLFIAYGMERLHAEAIVPRIIHRRNTIPITMLHEIESVIEDSMEYDAFNVMKLTELVVYALSSTVNDELNELHYAVRLAEEVVVEGGDALFYLSSKTEEATVFTAMSKNSLYMKDKYVLKASTEFTLHFEHV